MEQPKPTPSQFKLEDFSPQAQEELQILMSLESFLKRVEGIKGEESFMYVAGRKYLVDSCQKIAQREVARLTVVRAAEAAKNAEVVAPPLTPEPPKAPETPTPPPLTLVK